MADKQETESKFGIYAAIKDGILDFFMPSRKRTAERVDLSKVQKDGRTERAVRQPVEQPAR